MRRLYNAPAGFTRTPEINRILGRDPLFHSFEISAEDLIRLANLLPSEQMDDTQNCAPSFSEFWDIAVSHPTARFIGYRVDAGRDDERITIEGMLVPIADWTDTLQEVVYRHMPDEDEVRYGVRRIWYD